MKEHEFTFEYQQEPPPMDPAMEIAYHMAADYYEQTEAYDKTVCTGKAKDGTAMPTTGEERRSINQHSQWLRDQKIQALMIDCGKTWVDACLLFKEALIQVRIRLQASENQEARKDA
jgi:hypothetical protein